MKSKYSGRERMIDMSVTEVRSYLKEFNMADRMKDFEASSATVELAAKALGVEEDRQDVILLRAGWVLYPCGNRRRRKDRQ